MKIGIIGGGASGTYLAIRLKELNPSFDVTIIERNDKLMKKLAVTGNGRCNYANTGNLENKYNDDFALKIINNLKATDLVANFERYGIHPTMNDNLVYPVTLSAQTVILMLNKKIKELGVNLLLNEKVLTYENMGETYRVVTSKKVYTFDKLVFASGGKAYPQLGTDGGLYSILIQHHYPLTPLSPSLTPIKVKENTKKISGQRVKCTASLLYKNKECYSEDGEVLFKDDGLSGIVILNMSQKINALPDTNDVKIVLKLAPLAKNIGRKQYSEYVHPKIANYLVANDLDINNVVFTFKAFYDFDVAQVSHGGVAIEGVTTKLESKKEKGLYFIGEILDIDGACGGFNLMFAFASAETVAKAIKE